MKKIIVALSLLLTTHQPSLPYFESEPNTEYHAIAGLCAAVVIAGGAYAAYCAYGNAHDRSVNHREVIDALEQQFLSTIQSAYTSYTSIQHNHALYMDDIDHHSVVRSVLSAYSSQRYPYVSCAHDIEHQLRTIEHNMHHALEYMELIATFINNEIAINTIHFDGKHTVIRRFFYFDPFTYALPRGPQNAHIRSELIRYHSRLETFLQDAGPLKRYLQDLRATIEQLPEYQHEKSLKNQADLQARQLEEARRLEKDRQAHEWRLEQARQNHEREMKKTPKVQVNYHV